MVGYLFPLASFPGLDPPPPGLSTRISTAHRTPDVVRLARLWRRCWERLVNFTPTSSYFPTHGVLLCPCPDTGRPGGGGFGPLLQFPCERTIEIRKTHGSVSAAADAAWSWVLMLMLMLMLSCLLLLLLPLVKRGLAPQTLRHCVTTG